MTCERCYRPLDEGEHGQYVCMNRAAIERDRAQRVELHERAHAVWTDDIPGGVLMHNGICNPDGTPKRYYTHSAIRKACEAKGMIPYHDVYGEGDNHVLKAGREYTAWHKTEEYARIKRDKVAERREKQFERERAGR